MRTRSRTHPFDISKTHLSTVDKWTWDYALKQWVQGRISHYYYTPSSYYTKRGYEITTDELHKGPPYRKGGPFDNHKMDSFSYFRMPSVSAVGVVNASKVFTYGTPIIPFGGIKESNFPSAITTRDDYVDSKVGSLTSHGKSAYTKYSPLKPSVDLGQTLAEIKDVPRMLRSTAKHFSKIWRGMGGAKTWFGPKHVANEWLNTQFGWVPFLSTIVDFVKTTSSVNARLKRLRRHNGKWEKRGGRVARVVNEVEGTSPSILFTTDSRFVEGRSTHLTWQTTLDAWFTARYKYWLPQLEEVSYPGSVLAQMYGLRVSPKLLYDVLPWSWMASWVVNIDDILQSSDEQQWGQLVTKDAYIMGTTRYRAKIDATYSLKGNISSDSCTSVFYYDFCRKRRIPASPFGFDVHFPDLSPWKVSILAALGISKMF